LWSLLLLLLAAEGPAPRSAAQEATMLGHEAEISARGGNYENALVQYQMAYERVHSPDYLFNMAQCEFVLDRLGDALAHYQQYLQAAGGGDDGDKRRDSIELARKRIETINRREFVVGINASPAGARVRIDGAKQVAGFAPSNFLLPRGHYTITISRQDYATQTQPLDVETRAPPPLFFTLRPIPGRLSIRTRPPGATLYVRGNRAQNPYDQAVEPGKYEIYAEATDYQPRRTEVEVEGGQRQPVNLELDYLQRSGHPELIWFWTTAGAVAGGTFVLARLDIPGRDTTPASGSLVAAGAIGGGIAGAFASSLSKTLAPDYIRDNRAMFRITASVIGSVEGASIGLAAGGSMAGWLGGMAGLGAGTLAGVWLDDKAPNYGRVVVIQSGAALGLAAGALAIPALKPEKADDDWTGRHRPLGILLGVNVGLAAGLALAYLPDQRKYGPSWQRVMFIDLATAAGAFFGAVTTTIDCIATQRDRNPQVVGADPCRFASRQQTMRLTLAGGMVGLGLGWFLTRNFDKVDESAERRGLTFLPTPTLLAAPTPEGGTRAVPGLAAQGRF
jgi:hypothetical protein